MAYIISHQSGSNWRWGKNASIPVRIYKSYPWGSVTVTFALSQKFQAVKTFESISTTRYSQAYINTMSTRTSLINYQGNVISLISPGYSSSSSINYSVSNINTGYGA